MNRRPLHERAATLCVSMSLALGIVALLAALPGVARADDIPECIEACLATGASQAYCEGECENYDTCYQNCIELGNTDEHCEQLCHTLGVVLCAQDCVNEGGNYEDCFAACLEIAEYYAEAYAENPTPGWFFYCGLSGSNTCWGWCSSGPYGSRTCTGPFDISDENGNKYKGCSCN